jgi:hypothetical protein
VQTPFSCTERYRDAQTGETRSCEKTQGHGGPHGLDPLIEVAAGGGFGAPKDLHARVMGDRKALCGAKTTRGSAEIGGGIWGASLPVLMERITCPTCTRELETFAVRIVAHSSDPTAGEF